MPLTIAIGFRILIALPVFGAALTFAVLSMGMDALLAAIPKPASSRRPKKRQHRKRERGVRRSATTNTSAARQKLVDERILVEHFSQTLPAELWSRIFELATYVPGSLPTSETHSPNTLTPYHLSSTYDDDTHVQAKLRKMQRMKFQLLFMCKDWLDFALHNLYQELHIGSSQALFCLADRLSSVGEADSDVNLGRFVPRLDIAMRDRADNDAVASALLKVLDRAPKLQVLVIRRQFGSFNSATTPIASRWGDSIRERVLPQAIAAALLSHRLPNLRVVSSFYPFTFAAKESRREITLVGRISVVPLKAELGICADVSVNDSSAVQSALPTTHLSIVNYSDKLVPQIFTLTQMQQRELLSIELADVFGECFRRFQPQENTHFRIDTLLEHVAAYFPTVQNIDVIFPCYVVNTGFPNDWWGVHDPYPFKTLGFRLPPHYRKDDVWSVLCFVVSGILRRSPFMGRIRILDQHTSQVLVHSHHQIMQDVMRSYPRVRVDDWRGKELVFHRHS